MSAPNPVAPARRHLWNRTWFRIALALGQSAATAMHWRTVENFAEMRRDYPPEVLAAAHFYVPAPTLPLAVIMTLLSVWFWVTAYRSAER